MSITEETPTATPTTGDRRPATGRSSFTRPRCAARRASADRASTSSCWPCSEDLRWAETQGARVARHNLTSDPDAFVANTKVTGLMQALGEKALPILLIDGEIRAHGHYPTRDELASLLADQQTATPAVEEKSSGCWCSPGSSC